MVPPSPLRLPLRLPLSSPFNGMLVRMMITVGLGPASSCWKIFPSHFVLSAIIRILKNPSSRCRGQRRVLCHYSLAVAARQRSALTFIPFFFFSFSIYSNENVVFCTHAFSLIQLNKTDEIDVDDVCEFAVHLVIFLLLIVQKLLFYFFHDQS